MSKIEGAGRRWQMHLERDRLAQPLVHEDAIAVHHLHEIAAERDQPASPRAGTAGGRNLTDRKLKRATCRRLIRRVIAPAGASTSKRLSCPRKVAAASGCKGNKPCGIVIPVVGDIGAGVSVARLTVGSMCGGW